MSPTTEAVIPHQTALHKAKSFRETSFVFLSIVAMVMIASVAMTAKASAQTLGVNYLYNGSTSGVASGDAVYITGDLPPKMPTIQVFINRFTVDGITDCGTINYWVYFDWASPPPPASVYSVVSAPQMGYAANAHTFPSDNIPSGSVTCGLFNSYQTIDFSGMDAFYGGTMRILWKLVGSDSGTQEFDLNVLGINPANSDVNTQLADEPFYLDGSYVTFPANLYQGVIYVESGANGFRKPGGHYHQFITQKCTGYDCPYATYGFDLSAGSGGPLWDWNPQGLGLGQIDKSQEGDVPPVQDYFNWTNNLGESFWIMEDKLRHAETYWDASWARSPEIPPTSSNIARSFDNPGQWAGNTLTYPYPVPASGGCTFTYNSANTSNDFIFASAVKGYNGFHSALSQTVRGRSSKISQGFLSWIPAGVGSGGAGWYIDDFRTGSTATPYVESVCRAPHLS